MISKITYRGIDISYANNEDFFKKVEAGLWESDTFDVLDEYIKKDEWFIDIGAWVGVLSIYAEKRGAWVYAIEPDKVAYDYLVENIAANNLIGQMLFSNVGVSKKNGMASIYSSGSFGDSGSSLLDKNANDKKEVQTITLRTINNGLKNISLIKIDCEGSESIFINDDFMLALYEAGLPPVFISLHPFHYEDLEKDCFRIYNQLNKYYQFNCGYSEFSERVNNRNGDHSFMLT